MLSVLVGIAAFLALVVLVVDILASLSLMRTKELTTFQKVSQAVIVWLVPLVGAWLVLHLLGQTDREAVTHWCPNETINDYVFQALAIEGRVATRAAEHQIEQAIRHTFSSHPERPGDTHSGVDGGY